MGDSGDSEFREIGKFRIFGRLVDSGKFGNSRMKEKPPGTPEKSGGWRIPGSRKHFGDSIKIGRIKRLGGFGRLERIRRFGRLGKMVIRGKKLRISWNPGGFRVLGVWGIRKKGKFRFGRLRNLGNGGASGKNFVARLK